MTPTRLLGRNLQKMTNAVGQIPYGQKIETGRKDGELFIPGVAQPGAGRL